MASWRSAVGYGLLVWLIPFTVAFCIFPVKHNWRSLFESVMPVVLGCTAVVLALVYFQKNRAAPRTEGLRLGALWMLMSILIDLPLMLSPPIQMPFVEYVADIGLTYLLIPVIATGIAIASRPNAPQ